MSQVVRFGRVRGDADGRGAGGAGKADPARELIVLAAKAALDVPEVELSVRGALNHGAEPAEVVEAIVQCAPYIGFPNTDHALRIAQRVFDQWEERDDWKP